MAYRNNYAISKRFGVEQGVHGKGSANYLTDDNESPRDFEKRLTKEVSNNYDARKHQEAFDLAYHNAAYAETLDPKLQSFLKDYKKNDKRGKGIDGINTIDDVHAIQDFGALWHTTEGGNSGKWESIQDYSEATDQMMESMRNYHNRNFALKSGDEDTVPEEEVNNNFTPSDPNAALSPEHQKAQDLVSEYTNAISSGQFTKDLYADPVSADKPQQSENVSQEQTEIENNTSLIDVDAFASKQKSMAAGYLDKFKKNMSEDMNFKATI